MMAPDSKTSARKGEKSQAAEAVINVSSEEESQHDATPQQIPWSYKWVALVCIIALPIGSNWTSAALGPLKNTLREELGINNTQFGVITSADSFVNTILPILGGLVLDWWGPNSVTMCCTFIVFLGSIVAAVGVQLSIWRVLATGHILMGFGVAILDSATQKMFYHWFGAGGFAFVFGLENAIASTVGVVSGMVAIPIRNSTGWYGWTFWVPVFFCFISFAINVFYVFFERFVVPEIFRLTPGRVHAISKKVSTKRKFEWNVLFQLPWQYLMLPATQLLQSGAADGFSTSSADIIFKKGYTEEVAGYLATTRRILPIVLSPVVGFSIDRWGHRFHYVAAAPILWIISCSMLGFTNVHPLVALVFASLAGVINAMPLQICFPLLVRNQDKLGTAFGVWRAFNNSGSTIMEVAYGILQDGTEAMGYSKVLLLAIGLKAWAFALGVTYILIDFKFLGRGMTMTRKKREALEAEIEDESSDPLTRRTPKKWFTIFTLSLLVAMVATAWTLFIRYLI